MKTTTRTIIHGVMGDNGMEKSHNAAAPGLV